MNQRLRDLAVAADDALSGPASAAAAGLWARTQQRWSWPCVAQSRQNNRWFMLLGGPPRKRDNRKSIGVIGITYSKNL